DLDIGPNFNFVPQIGAVDERHHLLFIGATGLASTTEGALVAATGPVVLVIDGLTRRFVRSIPVGGTAEHQLANIMFHPASGKLYVEMSVSTALTSVGGLLITELDPLTEQGSVTNSSYALPQCGKPARGPSFGRSDNGSPAVYVACTGIADP